MRNRRDFLRDLGLSAAALPFVTGLPSLHAAEGAAKPRQRLIIMFSPNGTLPPDFWPDEPGPL
ncbi:MAG: twin-arginine translocation signal domain-containing protein, partial [Akkermansiaceae bacterium]